MMNKTPRAKVREDGWPTRADLQLMSPAEEAIYHASQVLELAGAHPLLTRATILLGEARSLVADFIEGETEVPVDPKDMQECVECGKESFIISPLDPCDGFCWSCKKVLTIKVLL
jgi:hypothetical protein